MTAEANLNVWGELLLEHPSSKTETFNRSEYDIGIRNGDTDRAIHLIVRTIGSTSEIQITKGTEKTGSLEITHTAVSGVVLNNPDTDGCIKLRNNHLPRLHATNTGFDVYGVFATTGNADIAGIHYMRCINRNIRR